MGFEVCVGVPWGEETPHETALPQEEEQERAHSCLLVLRATAPGEAQPAWPSSESRLHAPQALNQPQLPSRPWSGPLIAGGRAAIC